MDLKRLINRTLFFVAICAVVMAITEVFGDVNSLVGVAIVVIGLMMLQRDLSVRPVWNTGVMILFTACWDWERSYPSSTRSSGSL